MYDCFDDRSGSGQETDWKYVEHMSRADWSVMGEVVLSGCSWERWSGGCCFCVN